VAAQKEDTRTQFDRALGVGFSAQQRECLHYHMSLSFGLLGIPGIQPGMAPRLMRTR
jgi:hypothetical protein